MGSAYRHSSVVRKVPAMAQESTYGARTYSKKLAMDIVSGDTLMESKTIYDIKHKTKAQISDILLEAERQFLALHPDYKYQDYKYKDGPYGERTVFLIFKKQ